VVQELADYIQKFEPNIRGFSAQNIWRMQQFYEMYVEIKRRSLSVRELTCHINRLIAICLSNFNPN
jgi:hypothetical protein